MIKKDKAYNYYLYSVYNYKNEFVMEGRLNEVASFLNYSRKYICYSCEYLEGKLNKGQYKLKRRWITK